VYVASGCAFLDHASRALTLMMTGATITARRRKNFLPFLVHQLVKISVGTASIHEDR
jgi:hypothetical protein